MDERHWLPIISGQRRDPVAVICRIGLALTSFPYKIAIALRNFCFERGWLTANQAELPIISIGNLTTGGTGKSPLVRWIAETLRRKGFRVCVLSRGYRGEAAGQNDESLELAARLPDVPQLIDSDRVTSARVAAIELEMQVALLDDGFQHRQLARNLDIVVIDATNPFGHGWLLPRGLLREPANSLRRAGWIIISRGEQATADELSQLQQSISKIAPNIPCGVVETRPAKLLRTDGVEEPISRLTHAKTFAFCGLGNPLAFFKTVAHVSPVIVGQESWPDHHPYSAEDLKKMTSTATAKGADLVLCSHKDLVKIGRVRLGELPLFALVTEIEFRSGESDFVDEIVRIACLNTNVEAVVDGKH